MKIVCNCGNECEFKLKTKDYRQFFTLQEKVMVGSFDTFSVALGSPATMGIEIGCKKCGTYYRIDLFDNGKEQKTTNGRK